MPQKRIRSMYRSCTPVVDARYETDDSTCVSGVLVEAIADAKGVSPTEVPPLYETVDLDALSRLFERSDGAGDPDALFSFTFEKWNVFVRGDGRIRVCDGTRQVDPEPVFEGVA